MRKKSADYSLRAITVPLVSSLAAGLLSAGCIGTKTEMKIPESAAVLDDAATEQETGESTPEVTYVVGENAVEHTIVSGDTLSGIGAKYGVSVSSLQKANNLTTSRIIAGKKLIVPGTTKPLESAVESVAETGDKPVEPVSEAEEPLEAATETEEPVETETETEETPSVEELTPPPSAATQPDDELQRVMKEHAEDASRPAFVNRTETVKSKNTRSLSPRQSLDSGSFIPVSVPPAPNTDSPQPVIKVEDDEFTPIIP